MGLDVSIGWDDHKGPCLAKGKGNMRCKQRMSKNDTQLPTERSPDGESVVQYDGGHNLRRTTNDRRQFSLKTRNSNVASHLSKMILSTDTSRSTW